MKPPEPGSRRRARPPRGAAQPETTQRRSRGRPQAQDLEPERLHKLLSRHGVASRRQIEEWVAQGRISINGQPAQAGAQATLADRIELDGKPIIVRAESPPRVYAYRKRIGELVTQRDPERRPTVFKRLPKVQGGRWIAVGRLDINTSGLMLFTTDGELAARLMHPSQQIEREYAVRVLGGLSEEAMAQLRAGVMLEDGPASVLSIAEEAGSHEKAANRWYRLILAEGRNREVRRMIEAVGGQVSRLMRVRYGPILIPTGVPSGRGREVEGEALDLLYSMVGLRPPVVPQGRVQPRR